MILANLIFGSLRGKDREVLEEAAERYLVSLFRGGQIDDDWLVAWVKGQLRAHVMLVSTRALSPRFHTEWAILDLAEVVKLFGREPVVKILDDKADTKTSTWRRAKSLYLFSSRSSPVHLGDGGNIVPLFMLPVPDQTKEELLFWRRDYDAFDRIWFRSRALEVQAYRLMADPLSDLSEEGRRLCREVEQCTGIPTFYYLMRYWSRSVNEEERVCPGCGRSWKASEPEFGEPFYQFHFKCDPCRLVSHVGKSAEGVRRARIGEYVPPKPSSRNKKS